MGAIRLRVVTEAVRVGEMPGDVSSNLGEYRGRFDTWGHLTLKPTAGVSHPLCRHGFRLTSSQTPVSHLALLSLPTTLLSAKFPSYFPRLCASARPVRISLPPLFSGFSLRIWFYYWSAPLPAATSLLFSFVSLLPPLNLILFFLAVFTTAIFLFTFSSPFRLVLQIPACTVAPGLLSARDLTAGRSCFPSSLRALYMASLSVSHGLCHRISGKLPTCTWKVFPLPPQSPRLVTVGSHAHLETPETQTPFVCRPQPASPTPSLTLSAQCPLLPGALLSLLCGPSDPAGGGAEAGPGPPADERVFICTRVCAMFGGEAGGGKREELFLCAEGNQR